MRDGKRGEREHPDVERRGGQTVRVEESQEKARGGKLRKRNGTNDRERPRRAVSGR